VRVVPVVVRTAAIGDSGGGGSDAGGGEFTVQAPGWVEPDPYPVAVAALTDGVVEEVLALEGQAVKKGDVVARLIADDARIALAQAEAAVRQRAGDLAKARATLAAARSDWDNPTERTRAVAAHEAMLAESEAELERLPSLVAAEAARADELADAARRKAQSAASSAATESELVQARLKAAAQQAVLASTRASGPVLEAKVRQEQAELVAARVNAKLRIPERQALDEAEASVAQAEGALAEAEAQRDEARLRLARTEVRAPADGVVMSRYAEPGSAMMLNTDNPRSAQVFRLYDPAKLQVRVDVPLADAARVSVGQRAKVVVGVLPDRAFDGVVTRVVPEADIQRNTLQVKVRIDDPAPQLRPEMLTRVRFDGRSTVAGATTQPAGGASQQVFAPEAMLKREADGRARVWVVDRAAGRAELRDVTAGDARAGGWVAVREGLNPGEELIAGDTAGLRSGQRVRVVGEAEEPGPPAGAAGNSKGGEHAAH
jgi:HlyD family secretion protein